MRIEALFFTFPERPKKTLDDGCSSNLYNDRTMTTNLTRSADVPVAVVGAAIVRQQAEKIRAAEPGARLGEDVEALHRMRVETLRLRAALRMFVPDQLQSTFEPIKAGARELARALGDVRNLDVLREDLRARAEAVPADAPAIGALLGALERVRDQRREELLAVLDEPATKNLWPALTAAADALEASADPRVTVRRMAPRLIRRRLKKVTRAGDRLRAPTAPELHQLRIRAKRLRYACEFFKPWFKRHVEPLLERTTRLQDTLGTLHEVDVMPDLLPALADVALAGAGSEPALGYELARATLALVRDRLQERDKLLIRFWDQRADLRALRRATRFKAT
jgi:triphosphatase